MNTDSEYNKREQSRNVGVEHPRQVFSFSIFSFFQNRKYGRQLQMSKHIKTQNTYKKVIYITSSGYRPLRDHSSLSINTYPSGLTRGRQPPYIPMGGRVGNQNCIQTATICGRLDAQIPAIITISAVSTAIKYIKGYKNYDKRPISL